MLLQVKLIYNLEEKYIKTFYNLEEKYIKMVYNLEEKYSLHSNLYVILALYTTFIIYSLRSRKNAIMRSVLVKLTRIWPSL
jgi:hypothetical protein